MDKRNGRRKESLPYYQSRGGFQTGRGDFLLQSEHSELCVSLIHVLLIETNFCTRNYWRLVLFPSSGVVGSRKTTFRKLNLFLSSGECGRRHLLS
jgi:hypothetical protein